MFFFYDPQLGFEVHDTLEEAASAAQEAIDYHRDNAGDGWSEDVTQVCYGEVRGHTVMCDKRPATEGSALDYICDYRLTS